MAKQEKKKYGGDAYGIAGFVLGVASIVLALSINITLLPLASVLFGIIGLALSIKQQMSRKTGLAVAGIALNIIGIVASLLLTWGIMVLVQRITEEIARLQGQLGALGSQSVVSGLS